MLFLEVKVFLVASNYLYNSGTETVIRMASITTLCFFSEKFLQKPKKSIYYKCPETWGYDWPTPWPHTFFHCSYSLIFSSLHAPPTHIWSILLPSSRFFCSYLVHGPTCPSMTLSLHTLSILISITKARSVSGYSRGRQAALSIAVQWIPWSWVRGLPHCHLSVFIYFTKE